MAETPPRCVSFASKTVKTGNNDLDENSNEDVTFEVDIHDDPEYSAHGNWNWICPRQHPLCVASFLEYTVLSRMQ